MLKLYAWEPSFLSKITGIRETEVTTLKKVAYLGAVQTFVFQSATTLIALAAFATFVLVEPSNVLDAQIAFVSLSYFNIMRQPLNQLPNVIVQLIQMQVSLTRTNDFLNAPEVDPGALQVTPGWKEQNQRGQQQFRWTSTSASSSSSTSC